MDRIGRNELCPCGSGEKFKKCHLGVADEELYDGKRQAVLIEQLYRETEIEYCLYAGGDESCSEKIIGAHSIQNNGVISKLAQDGHVLMPSTKSDDIGIPRTSLRKVGRNQATTFSGFCSKHDNDIFKEIDLNNYNQTVIQNFLYAYRSFSKEYFEKLRQLKFFQKIFSIYPNMSLEKKFVSSGIIPALVSHNDNKIDLSNFNEGFKSHNYNILETKPFKLDFEVNFSTSAMFEMGYDLRGEEIYNLYNYSQENKPPKLFLNIFPEKNISWIILSCFRNEYHKYHLVFEDLTLLFNDNRMKFYNILTNLIMSYTDNIVIGNRLIENWGEDKTNDFILDWELTAIQTMSPLVNNLLRSSSITKDSSYNLFESLL